MATPLGQSGVLQVVPPAALEQQLQQQAQDKAAAAQGQQGQQDPVQLIGYIKGQFEIFRNHRNTAAGWSNRMLAARGPSTVSTMRRSYKKFGSGAAARSSPA